jgi:leucyl-tRNA synthetase
MVHTLLCRAMPRGRATTPAEIEPKWQRIWDDEPDLPREFGTRDARSVYILDMFPYPSGSGLHVGHPEGYTATDIVARYKRMRGFDVLHPMGWDAFGLPAEQHAIQTGTHPRATTLEEHRDLQAPAQDARLLVRLVARGRHDRPGVRPKWTQWIFLQLFKKGLAFQSEIPVNWCAGARHRARRTRRSSTARASAGATRSSAPAAAVDAPDHGSTPTGLDEDLAGSTGPRRRRSSTTGSGEAKARRSTSRCDRSATGETIRVFTTRVDTLPGRHVRGARARAPARRDLAPRRSEDGRPSRTSRRARSRRATSTAPTSRRRRRALPLGAFAKNPATARDPHLDRRLRHRHLRHRRGDGRSGARHARSRVRARARTADRRR